MEKITDFDFYPRLREATGLVLLLFTAPGCAACRVLKGLLLEYETMRAELTVWEANAVENGALVSEFEVFHLPALFLFRNGEFWRPIYCEAKPTALHHAVEDALSRAPMEAP